MTKKPELGLSLPYEDIGRRKPSAILLPIYFTLNWIIPCLVSNRVNLYFLFFIGLLIQSSMSLYEMNTDVVISWYILVFWGPLREK